MVRGPREDDPVLTMTNEIPDRDRARTRAPTTEQPAPTADHETSPTTEQPATEQPTTEQPAPSGTEQPHGAERRRAADAPRAARLYRSRDDRVIAGVCGGIARYFNIDPVLVRVGAVALAFLGGAGLLAYLAAVLLIPNEGEGGQPPEAPNRGLAITGVVLLVVAIGVVLPFHGGWGAGWGLVPLGFIALAGLFVWRLASGQRPEGDARAVLRAMALGVALIALCFVLAIGGAWAAAAGGNGVVAGHRHRGRPRADRRRLLRLLGALADPPGAGRSRCPRAWSPPPTSTSGAAPARSRTARPAPPRCATPIAWASGTWSSTCATRA